MQEQRGEIAEQAKSLNRGKDARVEAFARLRYDDGVRKRKPGLKGRWIHLVRRAPRRV